MSNGPNRPKRRSNGAEPDLLGALERFAAYNSRPSLRMTRSRVVCTIYISRFIISWYSRDSICKNPFSFTLKVI